MRKDNKIDRIGESKINKYGNKMIIINYKNNRDITVKFEDGYVLHNIEYKGFKNNTLHSIYDKTIYEIGYIGKGEYKVSINGKHTIQYNYWKNMFTRCYNENELKKHQVYEDKYVCEEWHNFQNFAKWFDENYYECNDGYLIELDKDILFKGNNVYNPYNCVFVSHRINTLFTKRQNDRGDYPIGVSKELKTNKFRARCCTLEGRKYLGTFDTPEQAFYYGYKPFKEKYIKEVAEQYKYIIPKILYDALYKYEVAIID